MGRKCEGAAQRGACKWIRQREWPDQGLARPPHSSSRQGRLWRMVDAPAGREEGLLGWPDVGAPAGTSYLVCNPSPRRVEESRFDETNPKSWMTNKSGICLDKRQWLHAGGSPCRGRAAHCGKVLAFPLWA